MSRGLFGLILFLFLLPALPAEEQGLPYYEEWLQNNKGHENYLQILLEAAPLARDLRGSLLFLQTWGGGVPLKDRPAFLARQASLEEMAGLPSHAAARYSQAALASAGKERAGYLIQSLHLQLAMGETDTAGSSAWTLYQSLQDPLLREKALVLSLLAQARGGDSLGALQRLKKELTVLGRIQDPDTWYFLRELARENGDEEELRRGMNKLKEEFPQSLAAYQLYQWILPWPQPGDFMGVSSPSPYEGRRIQRGAFQDKNRAVDLQKELQTQGFSTFLEEGEEGLWRVFVLDPEGHSPP